MSTTSTSYIVNKFEHVGGDRVMVMYRRGSVEPSMFDTHMHTAENIIFANPLK